MNLQERNLLEEFKAYLKEKFDKQCVDAYLRKPTASAITKEALGELSEIINETRQA
jgi:hypothetical protein